MKRVLVVPWSIAPAYCAMSRLPPRGRPSVSGPGRAARRASRWTWRRGPGAPRSAHPGSSRGPCGRRAGWWRGRPPQRRRRRARARRRTPLRRPRRPRASPAGRRASIIVLSPASAFPARLHAGDGGVEAAAKSSASAVRRGRLPELQEQRPVERARRRRRPWRSASSRWSSSGTATSSGRPRRASPPRPCMPRSMLMPWSASPIAASSAVSSSLASPQPRRRSRGPSPRPGRRRDRLRAASRAPAQPRRLHRRVPQAGQLVVQLEQRDRAARHLERGDVAADQVARRP